MTNTAVAAHPLRPKLRQMGNPKEVTCGFEFEFICPERLWDRLPELVEKHLGRVGAISKLYAAHRNTHRGDLLTSWHITGDSSISDYPLGESMHNHVDPQDEDESDEEYEARYDEAIGHVGVELVSPIIPATQVSKVLANVAKVLQEVKAYTNDTCGLHITLGNQRISQYLDPIKFALFLGDDNILRHFERTDSEYGGSMLDKVKERLANEDETFFGEAVDEDKYAVKPAHDWSEFDEDDEDYEDSAIEHEISVTPYEAMRLELLKDQPKGKGFLDSDRKQMLTHLAGWNTGDDNDRRQSVNLQKVRSNLVEYRAPGNYLPEGESAVASMAKIANIARRAVGAVLVAVGSVDSPEIDRQYATMLHVRFNQKKPNSSKAQGKLLPISGKETIRATNRINLNAFYAVTPWESLSSLAVTIKIDLEVYHTFDGEIGQMSAYVNLDLKSRVNGVPKATVIKEGQFKPYVHGKKDTASGYLSQSEIAAIHKAIRRLIDNPSNPLFAPVWKAAASASIAATRNFAPLTAVKAFEGVKQARPAIVSALREELPMFTAQLISARMNPTERDARYGNKPDSLVAKASQAVEQQALKDVLSDAGLSSLPVRAQSDRSALMLLKQIKAPLDTSSIQMMLDATAPSSVPNRSYVSACALIRAGFFVDAHAYIAFLTTLFTRPNYAKFIQNLRNRDPRALFAYAAAFIASGLSTMYSGVAIPLDKIEKAADELSRMCGRSTPVYSAQLSQHFKLAKAAFHEVQAYHVVWDAVFPAIKQALPPDTRIVWNEETQQYLRDALYDIGNGATLSEKEQMAALFEVAVKKLV